MKQSSMKRQRRFAHSFVGTAIGIACAFIVISAWAQKKKPKAGAPAQAAAAASAVKATAAPAASHHGKTPHTGHETKAATSEETKTVDEPKGPPPTGHQVVERESHIEFDERMVRGQSAAGAIYLFNRQPSEFKSIVKVPESFRSRTTTLVAPVTASRGDGS